MSNNFDKVIDRKNTNSMKWEDNVLKDMFGTSDVLPLWVADMDFIAPDVIRDKVKEVADFGIYGYSGTNSHKLAFKDWVKESFDWTIEEDWIVNTPGIVTAIGLAIQTFTNPGENILIQRPVYYPFTDMIEENGRNVTSSALINNDGHYEIDFEDFEEKAADPNTTMFLLCSPHNPISRVWTKDELTQMMDICKKYDVLVISDEIHNDLIMPGNKHYPTAQLDEKYADHLISCMAPSKTFNLAGMQLSNIIIENEHLRARFMKTLAKLGLGMMNPFALVAATVAYEKGRPWLEDTINYIHENFNYLREELEDIEGVKVTDLEATYLTWVDFRGLGFDSHDELEELMIKKAKVGLDGGNWFGPEGEGFMRFNLAAPREIIVEAVDRVKNAINK